MSIQLNKEKTNTSKRNVLSAEEIRRRLGPINPIQFKIWRQMPPAQRLNIAFQAYQFALDAVRLTERTRAEDGLTEEEFNWRVTRRMQGDQSLGREFTTLPIRVPSYPCPNF